LFIHGFAHLVGFVGPWRLARAVPYKTTLFADAVDVGDAGIRMVGLLWLVLAVAFGTVSVAAFARWDWWLPCALAASVASLVMCAAGWPEAKIGVAVNAALIALLWVARTAGWFAAGGGHA
jgi:hypothetical protein